MLKSKIQRLTFFSINRKKFKYQYFLNKCCPSFLLAKIELKAPKCYFTFSLFYKKFAFEVFLNLPRDFALRGASSNNPMGFTFNTMLFIKYFSQ